MKQKKIRKMAFEMIKINYNLWQSVDLSQGGLLGLSFSSKQFAKGLQALHCAPPAFLGCAPCSLGWLRATPWGSLCSCSGLHVVLWEPKNFLSTAPCVNSFHCACFPVTHTDFLGNEPNSQRWFGAREEGRVVPRQALGRNILGQVSSCPSWNHCSLWQYIKADMLRVK